MKRDEYIKAQAKFIADAQIVKGTKLKCFRNAKTEEQGWDETWISDEMDEMVGQEVTFREVHPEYPEYGILIEESDFNFPYFVFYVV